MNAYIALFAIAFEEKDYNKLALNLASILILKQFALNLKEWLLPVIKMKMKLKSLDRIWDEKEREDPNLDRKKSLHYVIEK